MPRLIKLVRRIFYNLIAAFKPLSVHTEAIVRDDVWGGVKKLALTNKVRVWYIMTPANFEYTKHFLNLKIPKKKYSDIIKKRYLWLIKHGQRVELHIHLNKFMNINKKEQEMLFKESISWGEKNLNMRFKEFVPGWWLDNSETKEILKKYKLRDVAFTKYKYIHDYDLIRS